MTTPDPARQLPFTHKGQNFTVKAIHDGIRHGWRIAVFKNGKIVWDEAGFAEDENLADALHYNQERDMVMEMMEMARDEYCKNY